jgi:transposase
VKIHFSVDENGLPLSMLIGRGNEHDSIRFQEVADEIRINIRRGRPRTKPALINADASYDSYSIRQYLRKRGIKCNIPVNKRNRKRPQIGRPPRLDQDTYRNRGSVERFFGWLKTGYRRLVIKYERLTCCFEGLLNLAIFLIYWKNLNWRF